MRSKEEIKGTLLKMVEAYKHLNGDEGSNYLENRDLIISIFRSFEHILWVLGADPDDIKKFLPFEGREDGFAVKYEDVNEEHIDALLSYLDIGNEKYRE